MRSAKTGRAVRSATGRWFLPGLLAALLVGSADAEPASAQLTDACGVACTALLGTSSFTFATGTMVAVGRMRGGYSTTGQAITAWTAGFLASAVTGVALRRNAPRQRRAAYGSGLGVLGGTLAGLGVEALLDGGTSSRRWAAAVVGAAVGVAVGGAVGALTWDGPPDPPSPAFQITVPLFLPLP